MVRTQQLLQVVRLRKFRSKGNDDELEFLKEVEEKLLHLESLEKSMRTIADRIEEILPREG